MLVRAGARGQRRVDGGRCSAGAPPPPSSSLKFRRDSRRQTRAASQTSPAPISPLELHQPVPAAMARLLHLTLAATLLAVAAAGPLPSARPCGGGAPGDASAGGEATRQAGRGGKWKLGRPGACPPPMRSMPASRHTHRCVSSAPAGAPVWGIFTAKLRGKNERPFAVKTKAIGTVCTLIIPASSAGSGRGWLRLVQPGKGPPSSARDGSPLAPPLPPRGGHDP